MKVISAALLLVSVLLLAHGGVQLYHVRTKREPVVVTCDQLVQSRPDSTWLRVTGCDIDFDNVAYRESNGHLDELFLPARPRSQRSEDPIVLLVATADPQALAAADQIMGTNRHPDRDTYVATLLHVVTLLKASKELDGVARRGLFERRQTRRALAGLSAPLVPDFVALDLHAAPSLVAPTIETGLGLALLLGVVAWPRFISGRQTMHEIRGVDATATQAPAPPMTMRLPALMLLNLDARAGAAEIEHAPPLGRHDEVTARIAGVLGPLTTTPDGRKTIGGPGWSLTLDLGDEETVWTITAAARGTEGSIAALEQLASHTGWRMFAPRLGAFVEASALAALAPTPFWPSRQGEQEARSSLAPTRSSGPRA